MEAMSSVAKESKEGTLNDLYASAKSSFYSWIILQKKLKVLDDNEDVLNFMIKSAELRYKNGLGKINAYYKAKAAIAKLESDRIALLNDVQQQKVMLNTFMNRDKMTDFLIDTSYELKEYDFHDDNYFVQSRSDIKAIEKNIDLTYLQQNLEKSKLKPQFGVKYEHMFGFGGIPMQYSLMAMMKLPIAGWSSKMYKANVESLKWKAESLEQQKQMMVNEASGMSNGMLAAIRSKKRQVLLYEQNIMPAVQKNFQSMQLAYEQNTEELFELFDAWETMNMTRMEYLDQLQELLNMQVVLEKVLQQK
jgi:outer membrane protein TolC